MVAEKIKDEPLDAMSMMRQAFEPFQSMQSEMTRMQEEMTRMMESFWNATGARASVAPGANVPAMRPAHPMAASAFGPMFGLPAADVAETETAYVISTELPGIDRGDVELSVSDAMITIAGEKKETSQDKRASFYMSERRFGRFQRSFPLPADIDREKIEAGFEKGVLTITLPKTETATRAAQKIDIKG